MQSLPEILMFGGSFNPVHIAHIGLVRLAYQKLSPEKIVIVPTFVTPLKDNSEMASAYHRLNMCALAFENETFVEIDDVEINRRGKSYTADTLEYLSEKYPTKRLGLIVGADMLLTIDKWKNPEKIFRLSDIIAVPRDKTDSIKLKNTALRLKKLGAECIVFDESVASVSSSLVRRKIKAGESIAQLVPEKVLEYIESNALYTEAPL